MSPSKTACIVLFLVGVSTIQCHSSDGNEAKSKTNRVLEGGVDEFNNQIKVIVDGMTKRISSFVTAIEGWLELATANVEEKIEAYENEIAEMQKQAEQTGKKVTECVENLESKFDKVLDELDANVRKCRDLEDMETAINQAKNGLPQVKETNGDTLLTLGINSFVAVGTQLTGAITTCTNALLGIGDDDCFANYNNAASNEAYAIYIAAYRCIRNKL